MFKMKLSSLSRVIVKRLSPKFWRNILLIIMALTALQCKDDIIDPPSKPAISLSTASVSFSPAQGGGNPVPQSVSITNGGGGSLTGLTVNVTYGPNQPTGWLSATLNTTTAPATLTLQATTASLAAGTYTASISVASTVADNSPKIVSVTFTASSKPNIVLSTTTVSFSATQGGGNPASQSVSVTNGGSGNLTSLSSSVSYGSGQPTGWLSATLNTTTAPATLALQATTGSLSAGTYTASVSVASTVAANSPQAVSVTFTIAGLQAGALKVNTSTTGSDIDQTGYVITITRIGSNLSETTNLGVNSSITFSNLAPGSYRVELSDIAANCGSGSNPRTVNVTAGSTAETTFNIACQAPPTRQITLRNLMFSNLNIHDLVQVKVATTQNGVFTRSDLLTPDPANCLSLPGESIQPGKSRTFDVTLGNNYFVFIGIGIWDLNSFTCPLSRPWFKRRWFSDLNLNQYYVWTVVQVTGHSTGNWVWTIAGSYLDGSLKVTPQGNQGLPFNVTRQNPIP